LEQRGGDLSRVLTLQRMIVVQAPREGIGDEILANFDYKSLPIEVYGPVSSLPAQLTIPTK